MHEASDQDSTSDEARRVVEFWQQAGPSCWFTRSDAFDAQCAQFLPLHLRASRRELEEWAGTATGALALVLLLDQIPRNVYRDSAHSYATDGLARHYADEAINAGFDVQVDPALRVFFYLPFEHSEALDDQRRSLELHQRLDGPDASHWAQLHFDLIERFGRFPHRNAALGRTTTPEEQAYLDAGGFAG
ncbi:DUF924 family protein [Cognatilysobacter bugurensis]|uniref:DUF924 domain-containing protein n=1 Tax=Cognatilysobacter bugurensis TaxID=543356 RepID=A0A918SY27_9GAMM|nr:DUF924 family protein [Lysobacter bugurensis]GHA78529.1 hypothetical protein GCM10007067_14720 [Lysobacter bugurensis]